MTYIALRFVCVICAVLCAAACSSTTPYYDSKFGYAVTTAKAMQTLNPNASKSKDPVTGMDGISAKEAIDGYHDSFKTPEKTFDVLTGVTSGGR